MTKKPVSKQVSVATNANSLFKLSKNEIKSQHCTQNIKIEIIMPEKENVVTGLIRGLTKIFKKRG